MDHTHGEWFTFIRLAGFESDCRRLGLDEEAVRQMELEIVRKPEAGAIVAGTGGLRKLRFALAGSGRGKSGSYRVGYVLLRVRGTVVMVAIFAKKDKANFSASERNVIRQQIERTTRNLA